jgi:DNA repair ATPase RecN
VTLPRIPPASVSCTTDASGISRAFPVLRCGCRVDGMATSTVAVLHGEDRVTELARMLGDPDAETARRHALAMLR